MRGSYPTRFTNIDTFVELLFFSISGSVSSLHIVLCLPEMQPGLCSFSMHKDLSSFPKAEGSHLM
jgi:hypothetical protein